MVAGSCRQPKVAGVIVLAIDTATTDLVVGLVDTDTGQATDHIQPGTRGHNEHLVPAIQAVLAEAGRSFADLGAIVVGVGPGPFTSLRIGMVTASSMGQALGIPVHGVTTHDAIATRLGAKARTLVATDARRKEIYWATYADGVRTGGPDVVKPAELELPHDVEVASVPAHIELDVNAERVDYTPRAAELVALADLDAEPGPLTPLYLRRPDAQVPEPKPKSPAIPDVELS